MLTIGSLFAGIGGIELGLERAGLGPVIFQAENDPYCLKVLEKHWPNVRRYTDVRQIDETTERPDLICGGFPCVDISTMGKRAGISGPDSGLWGEMVRCYRLVRPRLMLVENVAALLGRGMGRVLGDLAESGADAEWDSLRAGDFGAPHRRERVFILAYPESAGREGVLCGDIENSTCPYWPRGPLDNECATLHAVEERLGEPAVFGSDDGVPARVDRLRALGNAVVPQVAEWIGHAIRRSLDDTA